MDDSVETSYQPAHGLVVETRESLLDIELTDSTELWLIQCPINQTPDFEEQQLSLNIDGDGHLGSFEGSSGKSYEVVGSRSQGPEPTVIFTSESEATIACKISRRVSLIHYPEPSEFKKRTKLNSSDSHRSSAATSTFSGHYLATPTRSIKPRNSEHVTPTYSSRKKKSRSESEEPSKRRKVEGSIGNSAQDSGKGNSGVTSTESLEKPQEKKSKTKRNKNSVSESEEPSNRIQVEGSIGNSAQDSGKENSGVISTESLEKPREKKSKKKRKIES